MNEKDYLVHYGVLGMRWGVRKNPNRAYKRASDKAKKLFKKSKSNMKIHDKYRTKAERYRTKADDYYNDSVKYAQKSSKWMKSMNEVFKDEKYQSMMKKDFSSGEEFVNKVLENDRWRRRS